MFRLAEQQIDRTIEQRYSFLCVGLALMFLACILPRGLGFGLLTGFMIFALGIYAFSFRKWRTEPGIWMLAILLLVTLGPAYGYFTYLRSDSNLPQPVPVPVSLATIWRQLRFPLDAGIAMVVFLRQLRLALSVLCENWVRTKRSSPSP